LPELPEFRKYVAVACGERHTVLLQDDGKAVAFGRNMFGQCDIPELPPKRKYKQIAAGEKHTVLLRDDGVAFAFGLNDFGQCNVPELPKGRRPPYLRTAGSQLSLLASATRYF
jgi:alpha-tubulin suppressor-like RCC1 family protein